LLKKIARLKVFRLKSSAEPTRKTADTPALFFYISQPDTDYLVIPEVSSERRQFIPIGYASKKVICSNINYLIPEANLYILGMLCSTMYMAWVRHVCGRLKSDYRYTGSMAYNNYPWPDHPRLASSALPPESGGDGGWLQPSKALHRPYSMPAPHILKLHSPISTIPLPCRRIYVAHQALDKAVDAAYAGAGFSPAQTCPAYVI
jgi:hypothetical protein